MSNINYGLMPPTVEKPEDDRPSLIKALGKLPLPKKLNDDQRHKTTPVTNFLEKQAIKKIFERDGVKRIN